MSKLIKNGQVHDNPWQIVEKGNALASADYSLIHAASWQDTMLDNNKVGIWLDSEDSIDLLPSKLDRVSVVAVNFPLLTDGRGFSLARQIREQLEYAGELMAIGNFMLDQAFYLKRCGFDSFAVSDEMNVDAFKTSLNAFKDTYQAAVDEPRPLFRRRN